MRVTVCPGVPPAQGSDVWFLVREFRAGKPETATVLAAQRVHEQLGLSVHLTQRGDKDLAIAVGVDVRADREPVDVLLHVNQTSLPSRGAGPAVEDFQCSPGSSAAGGPGASGRCAVGDDQFAEAVTVDVRGDRPLLRRTEVEIVEGPPGGDLLLPKLLSGLQRPGAQAKSTGPRLARRRLPRGHQDQFRL